MLWLVSLSANTCTWMSDVTAAWLMTSLTRNPLMIALVQTAASLPVFAFGIVSGVLADTIDRRRYFIGVLWWVALVAALFLAVTLADVLTPVLLLALTFANGIGMAMRWPVIAALTAELAPRGQVSAAVALNGIAFNVSRIVGPMVAGALLAQVGGQAVFAINMAASVIAGIAVMRWKPARIERALPPERFASALRAGARYVFYSPRARYSLIRCALFINQAIALFALAPLIAMQFEGADAKTYALLLAAMGAGAIIIATQLAALRRRVPTDKLVQYGTLLNAAMMAIIAWTTHFALALAAMMVAGMTFVAVLNTLHVVTQLSLPNWVRARGMAWVQMATMGGGALGAAIWGQVATWTDVQTSLLAAAFTGVLGLGLTRRLRVERYADEEFMLSRPGCIPVPAIHVAPHRGAVVVSIQYLVDPAKLVEFAQVMRESRIHQLKHGALSWELLADSSVPNAYIEQFLDESWTEYLRRIERMTESDVRLARRRYALHLGEQPPRVTCHVVQLVDELARTEPRGFAA